MKVIYETDVLEAETSKKLPKYWQGFVVEDGGNYYTQTEYYQKLADGSESTRQKSELYLVEAKNVGKANEKNAKDQAIFNIQSDSRKQIDKGYHKIGEQSKVLPLPMLAHEYTKRKHSLSEDICVQPKLDGTRMLMGSQGCWSRQGKFYLSEVTNHLVIDTKGLILDGELMLPDGSFQDSVKAIKKFSDSTKELVYYVYDIVDSTKTFSERYEILEKLLNDPEGQYTHVRLVSTLFNIKDEDEIMKWHGYFISKGYEGTMIRDLNSKYDIGNRSVGLLKYKDFLDSEFEIVGVKEGLGKEVGCAIFTCRTPEGLDFDCRPKGTTAERQEMFTNRDKYIGQLLTVKYQELSQDKIPRFPVGISVRDYE